MNSIPASALVNVIPAVLGAGGNPLSLNAVILTPDPSIPVGTAQPFSNANDVANWFGGAAVESQLANIYFGGFIGATQVPGTLWFAQYNTAAVSAYVWGGPIAGLTLAQLQALAGNLIVAIDGRTVTSANINLASAASPSAAAGLITTGLQTAGGIFNGTGSITADLLTITAVASGRLHVGDTITAIGVTPGTTIVALGTGTGGLGTYHTSATPDVGNEQIEVATLAICSYDALRQAFVITSPTNGNTSTIGFPGGTLAPLINLTLATGAVLSQGSAPAVPATLMDSIVNATQNWATFMTVNEPDLNTKLAFANWVTTKKDRFLYVCADSDITPTESPAATGSFGYLTKTFDGVAPVWAPDRTIAAFVCAVTASINYGEVNGKTTYAFRGQAGLTPDVTDQTTADNLIANGYNFYGSYATANQQFQELQRGVVSGAWKYLDSYVNQIWFNAQLQLALMVFMVQVKSVPYNPAGYGLLRAALLSTIQQFGQFGGFQKGVQLSSAQIAEVNNAAGLPIDAALFANGYYLQILDPGAVIRGQRGSPAMTLWYVDGGSVQNITLASIAVQ